MAGAALLISPGRGGYPPTAIGDRRWIFAAGMRQRGVPDTSLRAKWRRQHDKTRPASPVAPMALARRPHGRPREIDIHAQPGPIGQVDHARAIAREPG